MTKNPTRTLLVSLAAAAAVLGCATPPSAADVDKATADAIKSSFRAEGIAGMDRLVQDDSNRECSLAEATGKPLTEARAKAIEEANLKTVKWPSDGKFVGDWKEGEKIAQNGRGMTWTDEAKALNGGNCYNCHQISKEEISFGTIGPSLYNYGKLRGVTNPNDPASKPIVEYTWGKIWNAKAYNACSNMPRAGHAGILNEQQVRHVVGLLLDPQSPVNK
ncbi:sulfur oxidation c-type cytochrome SoxX [uncultured Ramlibacter sp.]|uniref:sulfur oxidation c-type cytochrome SoxX n=1 Tax=uncultured Ramlibacter sp. TaxID=260755 RepID=UPI00261ED036|nr:sulfur oxidation c-type cytochrome SoxX [uncultured Ramlibacter sp.]